MVWLSGNVLASIIVVALRQTHFQPKSSGLVLSRRPLGAVLHSSNEPGEVSQWLCHDDSTINIVLDIIIIIIIINKGIKFNDQSINSVNVAWNVV